MFTLTAQDIHEIIVQTDNTADTVKDICDETGLLNPDGCAKTLCVGEGNDEKHNYQHLFCYSTRLRKQEREHTGYMTIFHRLSHREITKTHAS